MSGKSYGPVHTLKDQLWSSLYAASAKCNNALLPECEVNPKVILKRLSTKAFSHATGSRPRKRRRIIMSDGSSSESDSDSLPDLSSHWKEKDDKQMSSHLPDLTKSKSILDSEILHKVKSYQEFHSLEIQNKEKLQNVDSNSVHKCSPFLNLYESSKRPKNIDTRERKRNLMPTLITAKDVEGNEVSKNVNVVPALSALHAAAVKCVSVADAKLYVNVGTNTESSVDGTPEISAESRMDTALILVDLDITLYSKTQVEERSLKLESADDFNHLCDHISDMIASLKAHDKALEDELDVHIKKCKIKYDLKFEEIKARTNTLSNLQFELLNERNKFIASNGLCVKENLKTKLREMFEKPVTPVRVRPRPKSKQKSEKMQSCKQGKAQQVQNINKMDMLNQTNETVMHPEGEIPYLVPSVEQNIPTKGKELESLSSTKIRPIKEASVSKFGMTNFGKGPNVLKSLLQDQKLVASTGSLQPEVITLYSGSPEIAGDLQVVSAVIKPPLSKSVSLPLRSPQYSTAGLQPKVPGNIQVSYEMQNASVILNIPQHTSPQVTQKSNALLTQVSQATHTLPPTSNAPQAQVLPTNNAPRVQVLPKKNAPRAQVPPRNSAPRVQVPPTKTAPQVQVPPIKTAPQVQVPPINNAPRAQVHPINNAPRAQVHPTNNAPQAQVHPTNNAPRAQVHPTNNAPRAQVHPTNITPRAQVLPTNISPRAQVPPTNSALQFQPTHLSPHSNLSCPLQGLSSPTSHQVQTSNYSNSSHNNLVLNHLHGKGTTVSLLSSASETQNSQTRNQMLQNNSPRHFQSYLSPHQLDTIHWSPRPQPHQVPTNFNVSQVYPNQSVAFQGKNSVPQMPQLQSHLRPPPPYNSQNSHQPPPYLTQGRTTIRGPPPAHQNIPISQVQITQRTSAPQSFLQSRPPPPHLLVQQVPLPPLQSTGLVDHGRDQRFSALQNFTNSFAVPPPKTQTQSASTIVESNSPEEEDVDSCFLCGKPNTFICCGQFRYCSEDCKIFDLERHKPECTRLNR